MHLLRHAVYRLFHFEDYNYSQEALIYTSMHLQAHAPCTQHAFELVIKTIRAVR